MSDWITDRLPTRDDTDHEGTVWITRDSAVERTDFLNVFQRQAWMPIDSPPPYVAPPPEPDTSLELDRAEKWVADVLDETPLGRVFYSIIDAARKCVSLAEAAQGVLDFEFEQRNPSRDKEPYDPIANPSQFDPRVVKLAHLLASQTDPSEVNDFFSQEPAADPPL